MPSAVTSGRGTVRTWDVASAERLRLLAALPLTGVSPVGTQHLHRDLYFDTPDRALRRQGIRCRFRFSDDDVRTLTLTIGAPGASAVPATRHDVQVPTADPGVALAADNPVARRLRSVVDPALLVQVLELAVVRMTRRTRRIVPWRRLVVDFDSVTVRVGDATRVFHQVRASARGRYHAALAGLERTLDAAGAYPAPVTRLERAELLAKWVPAVRHADAAARAASPGVPATEEAEALDPELSFVAFQQRVLELAADPATPLAERLRFAAIVAANMDEFFAVRVAGLKLGSAESTEESFQTGGPAVRLAAIAAAARELTRTQQEVAAALLDAGARHGAHIRRWSSLTDEERAALRETYRQDVHHELMPLAMTLSPGHPIAQLDTLSLSLAVLLRTRVDAGCHLAQVEIPASLPRLVPVLHPDGTAHGSIPVEELVRHNLHELYPAHVVEEARCYRVTRGADLAVDEEAAEDLLVAVDDATRRRLRAAIVRVELDAATSPVLRDLLLDELRRESSAAGHVLGLDDVLEVAGMLDHRFLANLPLPADPALRYAPFEPSLPPGTSGSFLDDVGERDVLVHHPFASFTGSVVRFVADAADDDAVTAIKLTLYRAGDESPVIDALRRAARAGKQVHAFVELRARFDEARNVRWVRAMERDGVHVVYGLRGVKTHAKVALVVRREAQGTRRYAHVGSGNYNPATARAYTDLSLFTADPGITGDIADLFNALTGATVPVAVGRHGVLVAPSQLLDGLLERIAREAAHARAGREARIRIKVNGLSDPDVVAALGAASRAGVAVELVVRSICTLRPGVPGRTDQVRVVANAGRFLEHSRIFHFANGGSPEWFIGSSDLRTRNLRRRVELLAPVRDPVHQRALDHVLRTYLDDPRAWDLASTGQYHRRAGPGPGAQEQLLADGGLGTSPKAMRQHALGDTARVDIIGGAH